MGSNEFLKMYSRFDTVKCKHWNGEHDLVDIICEDGSRVKCTKCGTEFDIVNPEDGEKLHDIESSIDNITNLINTIKMSNSYNDQWDLLLILLDDFKEKFLNETKIFCQENLKPVNTNVAATAMFNCLPEKLRQGVNQSGYTVGKDMTPFGNKYPFGQPLNTYTDSGFTTKFNKIQKDRFFAQEAIRGKDATIPNIEALIKFAESGIIYDDITWDPNRSDHELKEYMKDKLNISEGQAEFILNRSIKFLDPKYLNPRIDKYKEKLKELKEREQNS